MLCLQLERKQGAYCRLQPDPHQLPPVTRSRGYDPGQRDQGTTGAVPRPGSTGRERLLDADGLRTSTSISAKEYRHVLCVQQATE